METAIITGALSIWVMVATYLLGGRLVEAPIRVQFWIRYRTWWIGHLRFLRKEGRCEQGPVLQVVGSLLVLPLWFIAGGWVLLGWIALVWGVPPAALLWAVHMRQNMLAVQCDGMMTNLSSALATSSNLQDALRSLLSTEPAPMSEEIASVLADVKLGRSLDSALFAMSERVQLPGLEVFTAALVMGRRTGGDISGILKETAATLREIERLEEVVKTRTAEGRNQALVMGLVPPFLVAILHWINPTWLAPMWEDPIGWLLLALAVVLELTAVILIRKITAVDI